MEQGWGGRTRARPVPRPVADLAFEIIGDPLADEMDIAAVFAQTAARHGDSVWMGYMPDGSRSVCRVRVGRGPVYCGGDRARFALVFEPDLLPARLAAHAFDPNSYVLMDGPAGGGASLPPGDGEAGGEGSLAVWRVPWRALADRIPGFPQGDRIVALGLLTWLFGYDPAVVRRVLENRLAARGRRVVSAALRLFELGWRDASPFVPEGCCQVARRLRTSTETEAPASAGAGGAAPPSRPIPAGAADNAPALVRAVPTPGSGTSAAGPVAEAPTGPPVPPAPATAVLSRLEVMGGQEALALGALTAGFTCCVAATEHPVADRWLRTFAAMGGRVLWPWQAGFYPVGAHGPVLQVEVAGAAPASGSMVGAPTAGAHGQVDVGRSRVPRVAVRIERAPLVDDLAFPFSPDPLAAITGCGAGPRPVVLAPTTVEECFHLMGLARRLARQYRRDVVLLVDAALLGAVQVCRRRDEAEARPVWADWLGDAVVESAAVDTAGADTAAPAAVEELWAELGVAEAPLEAFARLPRPVGGDSGAVLLIGWGMTRGPVEEAVTRLRARGLAVSALHLRLLSPWPRELGHLLARFRHVVIVDVQDGEQAARRRSRHLAYLLRAAAQASGQVAPPRMSVQTFARTSLMGPAAVEAWAAALAAAARTP